MWLTTVPAQPGSRVWCDNVYRLRLACTSGNESAETIRRLPRSSLWPNPNAPQEVSVVDVTYKVRGEEEQQQQQQQN